MLDHQDGICSAGKHPAGGDRRRKAADYRLVRHDTWRKDLAVQLRGSRRLLHRAERVIGPHSETVDIGAVETGNVHLCLDVVGKDSMQRFAKRHDLLAKRAKPEMLAEFGSRFIPGDDVEELRLAGPRLRGLIDGLLVDMGIAD